MCSVDSVFLMRFGDLEDPQRMLSQTSSNPQGRFPLCPLHSASQETATLLNPKYRMLTQTKNGKLPRYVYDNMNDSSVLSPHKSQVNSRKTVAVAAEAASTAVGAFLRLEQALSP
ncbi:hypothetical protein E5288_WYG013200 [Bos mutus]|uniref:Uncharacterized protein n=1 Tax=Bos mutus TaxID=72004 RepID=A0A6B0S9R2_9CETA|nr:hypothetical protein [Bos mutus]